VTSSGETAADEGRRTGNLGDRRQGSRSTTGIHGFDWKLSEFNELTKEPGAVKQVYDPIPIAEGRFLNNVKNSLNGLHFGFGIPDEQIKVVAALHGLANMLNDDDAVWSKVSHWSMAEDD
jgi:hypothetical protein